MTAPPSNTPWTRFKKRPRKRLRRWALTSHYLVEAAACYTAYGVFRVLPLDWASGLGAWIFRTVGMRMGATRHAERNLALALPELTADERRRALAGMWSNLGRVAAEYPHLPRLRHAEKARPDRIVVEGAEHFDAARADGKPVVMALAHFGNWEAGPIVAVNHGVPLHIIVRPLNNPFVDRLLRRLREALGTTLLEKRMEGPDSRKALAILRQGGVLGVMVDQRYTGGLKVPFFGHDALTSPAAVAMAYHLDCAVLPMRIERTRGARYRAVVEPPLTILRTGDRKADVEAAVIALNQVVERWVRDRPDQWLWLHKRWKIIVPKPKKVRAPAAAAPAQ